LRVSETAACVLARMVQCSLESIRLTRCGEERTGTRWCYEALALYPFLSCESVSKTCSYFPLCGPELPRTKKVMFLKLACSVDTRRRQLAIIVYDRFFLGAYDYSMGMFWTEPLECDILVGVDVVEGQFAIKLQFFSLSTKAMTISYL
jgi:hypothetical protein